MTSRSLVTTPPIWSREMLLDFVLILMAAYGGYRLTIDLIDAFWPVR